MVVYGTFSWMVNLRTTHHFCKADLQQRYWNRYPGARVDSTIPHYEFSDPELFTEWSWTQRFPGSAELRSYFHYVAEKWNLRKDTVFSTLVTGAVWSETSSRWTIYTNTDTIYSCQFFLPNIGFAAKRHTPDWKGIDTFQGTWIHPSYIGQRMNRICVGRKSQSLALARQVSSSLKLWHRSPASSCCSNALPILRFR